MSTGSPQPPTNPPAEVQHTDTPPPLSREPLPPHKEPAWQPAGREPAAGRVTKPLKIYGHSMLFYWWPVWFFGIIMALLTYFEGTRLIIVEEGNFTRAVQSHLSNPNAQPENFRYELQGNEIRSSLEVLERIHPNKGLGMWFTVVLLVTIFVTSVPLRGLTSAVVILSILIIALLIALIPGAWDTISQLFGRISLHMNLGFYVFVSVVLFILWAIVSFGYDRMHYWKVTPGQITHEYVFGGGAKAFDTEGMVFEKLRDDIFRHEGIGLGFLRIIGLPGGTGDLIMHPRINPGGERDVLEIHNVWNVNYKLRMIQALIATKPDEARS